eukprot:6190429-Pleurochrysis_carterae.AAC.5
MSWRIFPVHGHGTLLAIATTYGRFVLACMLVATRTRHSTNDYDVRTRGGHPDRKHSTSRLHAVSSPSSAITASEVSSGLSFTMAYHRNAEIASSLRGARNPGKTQHAAVSDSVRSSQMARQGFTLLHLISSS